MAFVNPFKTTKVLSDFLAADVACVAGQFTEIGRIKLGAGEGLAIGYDNLGGMANAAGRIFFDPKKAGPTAMQGTLRITIESPKKREERTLFEGTAARLRLGATDPSIREPLPMIPDVVGHDWYLVLRFNSAASETLGTAVSTLEIDCTAFDDL